MVIGPPQWVFIPRLYDKLNRLTPGGSTEHYDERGITCDLERNIQALNRVYNGTVIDSLTGHP